MDHKFRCRFNRKKVEVKYYLCAVFAQSLVDIESEVAIKMFYNS